MRYLSVCSGIEAASAAWHPLGWTPVAFAEIEPFCAAVLAHHYPTVPNLGDFTKITPTQITALGGVDLLVGGTPCQAFSIAGARGGLNEHRGNLTLAFCDLAHALAVRHVIWENVPGVFSIDSGRTFARIIGALTGWEPAVPEDGWRSAGAAWGPSYALAWRVLDAQHFGVPQRRRRIFLVARQDGDWRACVAALWHLDGGGDWFDHAMKSRLSLSATIGAFAPTGWRRALSFATCAGANATPGTGGCVTLRMIETPAPGPTITVRLGNVLETRGAHLRRYGLSAEACRGILTRADRRGKRLPPALDGALRDGMATEATTPDVAGTLGGSPSSGIGGDLDRMTYVSQPIPILEATSRAGEREVRRAGLGIGAIGAPMYTLEATQGHGVAHTLTTAYDASPDGTGRGVPIVPGYLSPLAITHQSGASTAQIVRQGAYAGALGVTRQDAVLMPIAFDSMSGADADATYALRSSAAGNNQSGVLAYTIQTNDGGAHHRSDRPHGGMYVREVDTALTVGTTDHTLIAFTACDYGADAGVITPTLRAAAHTESHANGGAAPAVAYQQQIDYRAAVQTLALRGREGATLPELGDEVATAIRSSQGGAARAYVLHDAACQGRYVQTPEELVLPLRADTGSGGRQIVAFAQNERAEVRDLGGVAGALAAQPGAQQQTYVAIQPKGDGRLLVSGDTTAALTTADHARWDMPMLAFENKHVRVGTVSETLRSDSNGAVPMVAAQMVVRRLTPLECERLQGFPDGFTNIPRDAAYTGRAMRALSKRLATRGIILDKADVLIMIQDGPRYRALGNSMAVPCMAWIGQAIERVRASTARPVAISTPVRLWRWRNDHAAHTD